MSVASKFIEPKERNLKRNAEKRNLLAEMQKEEAERPVQCLVGALGILLGILQGYYKADY